jgi:hypothetical protein
MADPGPPTSSLSESWASLSNSEYTPDDDLQSENNDIGSLVDANDSEDVQSFDDRDDSSDSGPPSLGVEEDVPGLPCMNQPAVHSSAHNTGPCTIAPRSQDLESIEFDEPEHWPEVGHADVKQTLKVFEEDEAAHFRDSLPSRMMSSQLVGTIRMTMSKNGLSLNQPFRVLYNGRPAAMELRTDILHTLAAALIACGDLSSQNRNMGSSRYHVFPLEFGPGASQEHAEMIPIQTQLVVDDCIDATALEDSSGHEQIMLTLKNGDVIHSCWDDIWKSVQERQRWSRPDVVVLLACKETDSAQQKQTTQLIHECMLRHNVPMLVINEESGWSSWSQSLALDPPSLHRCIEERSSSGAQGRVLRRLPVDLDVFMNLDPEQLNKHLACLNDIDQLRVASTSNSVSFIPAEAQHMRPAEPLNDVEKNLSRSYMAQHQTIDFIRSLSRLRESLVLIALAFALIGWIFTASPLGQRGLTSLPPDPSNKVSATVSSVSLTASIPVAITATSGISVKSLPSSVPALRGQTDISQLLSDPFVSWDSKSDKFQVERIGDCHIVVKSPHIILQKRKEPKLQLRVMRGNETLNTQVSKLFDGVYAVKIELEEAYGPLNITIMVARPAINETVELDFGSPWLKMASWDKAGQRLLARMVGDIDLTTIRSAMQLVRENPWFSQNLSTANLTQRMQKLRRVYAKAQGSLTQLTDHVRLMTVDLRTRSIQQQQIMAEMLTHAHVTLQTLVTSSEVAMERTREYTEATASHLKEYMNNVRKRVSQIEVPEIRNKLQDITYSETLARAQDRAQKIIRDSVDRIKQHRKDAKRKLRCKKRCKKRQV